MRDLTRERWTPVPHPPFDRYYEVSDLGRVRRTATARVLSPGTKPKGYRYVSLQCEGVKQTFALHRLVALAHVPGHRDGLEVRHLRGVSAGDAADNLAWGTSAENARDRDQAGNNHNKGKTHCSKGHPFTPENTRYDRDGHRICRECGRIRGRIYDKERRKK